MKFRPCIDIHNGMVKQIVGGSLNDSSDSVKENFVANRDADYFANLYHDNNLYGGHIILLNKYDSPYYEKTKQQALLALHSFPGGLQVGGGINDKNAGEFLDEGASHVIITSFVFKNGKISYENLDKLRKKIGKKHLVLDLSCKKKNNNYYIVTDRWQKDTQICINDENLNFFANYCDEFLIHAVDVEGKMNGIEQKLVELLGKWGKIPITYAGGVHNMNDLKILREKGNEKLDVTIGSALDLFGGPLSFKEIVKYTL